MTIDRYSLDLEQALELVARCFTKEWPATRASEVELCRITGGFVNQIFVLSRKSLSNDEPRSVIIRLFGTSGTSNNPEQNSTSLSAAEQAVVCYAMASHGWGPKIYGLFAGGRIEEWIDSHPLTAAESMKPLIVQDVARSYARLHSLDLPLAKDNFPRLQAHLLSLTAKIDQACQLLDFPDSTEAKEFAEVLRNTRWKDELDWTYALFYEHRCKATLAVGDTNFLNVLVKDFDSECRVMLIDYETVSYSFRGIDIGGHFNERMYVWSHASDCLSGYDAPHLDEQRRFCDAYRQELLDLGFAADEENSVDQLLLESKIGRMWQIMFSFIMCLGEPDALRSAPLRLGLTHMMRQYHCVKAGFIETLELP